MRNAAAAVVDRVHAGRTGDRRAGGEGEQGDSDTDQLGVRVDGRVQARGATFWFTLKALSGS
jgi:hypothetical protein